MEKVKVWGEEYIQKLLPQDKQGIYFETLYDSHGPGNKR